MAFDLAEKRKLVEAEGQGIEVPIKDETGKPAMQADGKTPITITVVGSLSKRYREFLAVQRGRVMKSAAPGTTGAEAEKDEKTVGEESLRDQTEGVAACITGWSAGFTDGGKDFPYSAKNAMTLLTENPFVQRQLEAAMSDHARFFARSSSPSKG